MRALNSMSTDSLVVPYDANLNKMRADLQASLDNLKELSFAEEMSIKEFTDEIKLWDARWDKCRLYLEQEHLSVETMENISELQIIALRNLETAQESLQEAQERKVALDKQSQEASLSLSKLNSMEARQALLTTGPNGRIKSYEDTEEYRSIRKTLATVQGFISLRDKA